MPWVQIRLKTGRWHLHPECEARSRAQVQSQKGTLPEAGSGHVTQEEFERHETEYSSTNEEILDASAECMINIGLSKLDRAFISQIIPHICVVNNIA